MCVTQTLHLSAPVAARHSARRARHPRISVRCCSDATGGPSSSPGDVHASRRSLLQAAAAAPLLQLLPWAAATRAASAAGSSTPQLLTPAQQLAVDAALAAVMPKSKAPVMLRLVFHDAGTYSRAAGDGGLNASVRFELDRPDNFGLKRGWNVIEAAEKKLRGTAAEGVVSKADLVALAGAYAVRITGGPTIQVAVGRPDAAGPDPDHRLPEQDFSAEQQLANFAAKGLTPDEFIVLSGSHTLGSKGYGDPVTFDNTYFKTLLQAPWTDKANEMAQHTGIPTDHVLPDDPTCRPIIQRYADDQAAFFRDFAAAYVKLANLGTGWA